MGAFGRFAEGRPAGIGLPVRPGSAGVSLRQARSLLPASTLAGRPLTAAEAGTDRMLLDLGTPELLTAFADAALAAVDDADPRGDLLTTLRVWLEAGGAWDETARRLGVHRHTARNRIDRIARLLERPLDSAEQRFQLWLALRARDASRTTGTR